MHIIFGNEQADALREKYTVLELDIFQIGENGPLVSAYCAVDTVPFGELFDMENLISKHQQIIETYRQKRWDECLNLINDMMNKWGGAVDSFYQDLKQRVETYSKQQVDEQWTPIILKTTS